MAKEKFENNYEMYSISSIDQFYKGNNGKKLNNIWINFHDLSNQEDQQQIKKISKSRTENERKEDDDYDYNELNEIMRRTLGYDDYQQYKIMGKKQQKVYQSLQQMELDESANITQQLIQSNNETNSMLKQSISSLKNNLYEVNQKSLNKVTEIIKHWRDEFDLKISQLEIYYSEVLKIKRKQM